MHNFDNQTILVTGGSSGIGLACAQRLARAGVERRHVDVAQDQRQQQHREL